jgi:hypothetical protein
MKKLMNKIFLILGILFMVFVLFGNENYAANATISCTSTSETNKKVTIYVSGSAVQWNLKLMVDGQVIAKSSELENYESNIGISFSGEYTPTTTGTKTISIAGSITDVNGTTTDSFASKTLTVTAPTPVTPTGPTTPTTPNTPSTPTTKPSTNTPTKPSTKPSNPSTPTTSTKSSNSKLSSLQIAEGVFSPEFAKNVYEYAVMVPNEITKLSIAASQEHSRATVRIVGNEELQVGDNTVEIIVTAEDGSTSTYKIYATRALPELNLQTLSIYYIDENNQKVEIKLEPQFVFNTYEYKSLEKLSYTVKELQVDAIANRENAKVEIIGNKEIKAGKNEITIKVTLPNEEGLEEQKTYKITIEREDEPVIVPLTTMQKIKNWFSGVGASVGGWITANFDRIISGMLLIVAASFVGLTIYFAYDYKNYQRILAKLAEYNKENLNQRASVALNPEMANINENVEPIDIAKDETEIQETNEKPDEEPKAIKGRRFK